MSWTDFGVTLGSGILLGWLVRSVLEWRRSHPLPGGTARSGSRSGEQRGKPLVLPPSDTVDIAGRLVAHLYSLGRLGPDQVAPIGHTQQGMVRALEARQGSVARALSRLEAAHVVEVDRRHVAGAPRRLNVYRLTSLGEAVARNVQKAPKGSPSAPARTEPYKTGPHAQR